VLAGKKTGGKISGTLLINGRPRGPDFSHIAGYVEQFDSHNPFSNLREAIYFSGRLRLPPETSSADVEKKVDNVLDILGLNHLQWEMIGGCVQQYYHYRISIFQYLSYRIVSYHILCYAFLIINTTLTIISSVLYCTVGCTALY
jgi:hypothetical protein